MPNLTKTVSNLEKRVGALEKKQTQQDINIIPLIVKIYQTLKVTPVFASTTTYASTTQRVAGIKSEVAEDLTKRANFVALGVGETATVGSDLDFERFRKQTILGDAYDDVVVIDAIIDTQETDANGYRFTNCALILDGNTNLYTGKIIAGRNDVYLQKNFQNTLTVSSELTIIEV